MADVVDQPSTTSLPSRLPDAAPHTVLRGANAEHLEPTQDAGILAIFA